MYEVCAIANAPVDLLYRVSDDFLTKHGLEKGNWNPRTAVKDISLFEEELSALDFTMEAGGSIANSFYTLGKLGHKSYLMCTLGEDPAGIFFKQSMTEANCATPELKDGITNLQIAVLITEDGQRTFIPAKEAPNTPTSDEILANEEHIKMSDFLVVEGYVLDCDTDSVFTAIKLAKKHKVKIILTLSSPYMVSAHAETFARIVKEGVNMIIANEEEIAHLLKAYDNNHGRENTETLENDIMFTPRVVTHGSAGATYIDRLHHLLVPCDKNEKPIDTTGAGDAFLAGFLHGILDEHPVETSLHYGHKCASKVITVLGGRYQETFDI